jgi:hypothetical protein
LIRLALACLDADEYRPAPKFAGKSIPDPPRQKEPWTPPRTKLPRFLVAATADLIEQGMADPRERPATLEDIRAARVIFSLEGQGAVRLLNVPALPIKARWVTMKDTPVDLQRADGTVYREFDQDGRIWQAEEVRADRGDRWERHFGFVGHHVIARAPAAEVELAKDHFMWGQLPGGLDARIEPVEPRRGGFEPGKPILMIVRVRNRRGVDNAAPTEFLRRGADGRPSLRRGVSLAVFSTAPSVPESVQSTGIPREELEPKPMAIPAAGDSGASNETAIGDHRIDSG